MSRPAGDRATRRTAVGLALACAVSGLLVVVAIDAAQATVPGANGRIAFRRYFDAHQTQGAVFSIATDGSGEQQITRPPAHNVDDQPDWSPDGRRLVFSRCPPNNVCRIWIVNADGSGPRALTKSCSQPLRDRVPSGCEDAANASFAPDGAHVTFTRATGRIRSFPKQHTDEIEHSAIAIIGADGTGERVIASMPPYDSDANFPMLSPDARTVLFERAISPIGHPRLGHGIFTVRADGSGMRQVTPSKLRAGDNPDWSPDGSRILFRSNEDVGNFAKSQLYTIRPDGSGLTQLTRISGGAKLYSASWSPDGTRIVFATAPKGGLPDVFTMAADGSDVQQVTRTPQWDSAPDWGAAPGR